MKRIRITKALVLINVQGAVTPKVDRPELHFLSSAHLLFMLYICVKCHEKMACCMKIQYRHRKRVLKYRLLVVSGAKKKSSCSIKYSVLIDEIKGNTLGTQISGIYFMSFPVYDDIKSSCGNSTKAIIQTHIYIYDK